LIEPAIVVERETLDARIASAGDPELRGSRGSLVVFSDDWGRHPSSCQHLIAQLLPRWRVFWFNTIGTRPPRLDLLTFKRGSEKLREWLVGRSRHAGPQHEQPQVASPIMWPSFGGFGRRLNRHLLTRALRASVPELEESIGVTTLPIVADLVGRVPMRRWVYYCVDDLSEWPGLDARPLRRMERELIAKADDVVAVSEALVERVASLGRSALLLTHGVDVNRWASPKVVPVPPLEKVERPIIAFWGVVDRRLDTSWIRGLNDRLERGTIVLIGPENNPDPGLDGLSRVEKLGPLPFDQLPSVARLVSVLVMPYARQPATLALQPLKLKEYLATGRPVVVSELPSTRGWHETCDLAENGSDFVDAVLARVRTGTPAAQIAARSCLQAESWSRKAEMFASLLENGPVRRAVSSKGAPLP
jgi:hypothetical protein